MTSYPNPIRFRRSLLAGASAVALTLAACGGGDDDPADDALDSPAVETSQVADGKIGEIGETIVADCSGYMDCQVEVTVTDITLGEQCRYGTNDYGGDNDPEFGKLDAGEQYMQVWAEFAVTSEQEDDWSMMEDPKVVDTDGFTHTTGGSVDCRDSDEGHESWSNPVDAGSKVRVYEAITVPDDVVQMVLLDHVFDLPEQADASGQGDPAGEPAPSPAAEQPAPAEMGDSSLSDEEMRLVREKCDFLMESACSDQQVAEYAQMWEQAGDRPTSGAESEYGSYGEMIDDL